MNDGCQMKMDLIHLLALCDEKALVLAQLHNVSDYRENNSYDKPIENTQEAKLIDDQENEICLMKISLAKIRNGINTRKDEVRYSK